MKKRSLLIAVTLIVFAALTYALGWSSLFTVSSVEVIGTNKTVPSLIQIGEKLARVEPRVIIARYEKIEWVKNVEISRNWLSGKVSITLNERAPIAMFNNRAIDEEGASFEFNGAGIAQLPRIQGPSIDEAVKAAMFFQTLPSEITKEIILVKIIRRDSYVLEIGNASKKIEVLWGRNEENELKAKVFAALIARPENQKILRIDLSAPHAPIVK